MILNLSTYRNKNDHVIKAMIGCQASGVRRQVPAVISVVLESDT